MTSEPCTDAKRAQAGVAALELLHHEAVGDVAQAGAAVALEVRAEEAELGEPRDELARERAVAGARAPASRGRNSRLDEVAHGLSREELLLGEELVEAQEVDAAEVGHGGLSGERGEERSPVRRRPLGASGPGAFPVPGRGSAPGSPDGGAGGAARVLGRRVPFGLALRPRPSRSSISFSFRFSARPCGRCVSISVLGRDRAACRGSPRAGPSNIDCASGRAPLAARTSSARFRSGWLRTRLEPLDLALRALLVTRRSRRGPPASGRGGDLACRAT